MIIDLGKFIVEERPLWEELDRYVDRLEKDPYLKLDLSGIRRFHYLYQRASADLSRIVTFSTEPEIRIYLSHLVQRAYGEIHETRDKPHRLKPVSWFTQTFPRTFRRHIKAFWLAVAITLVGCAFGGLAVALDPASKPVILPFDHLLGSPSERVAQEESAGKDRLSGYRSTFSAYLMTHNIQVSILALALGVTYGLGTIILLFYNGVILGAVAVDYILAGEGVFLTGWLLPHGSVEIPAILVAGQAGLVLAGALVGRGSQDAMRTRLRHVSQDLVSLIFGVAVMLVWAGIVESFFSQYHEPYLPYSVKIGFGLVELFLLAWFLAKSGAKGRQAEK